MAQNSVIDSIEVITKQCKMILSGQNKKALRDWQEDCRNDSTLIKQQRLRSTIVLIAYFLQKYRILEQKSLLTLIIQHYRSIKKKIFGYLLSLQHFAPRDGECKFMLTLLNQSEIHLPEIDMYLKMRSIIISSSLNHRKKQQLTGITCALEEWFGLINDIFNVNRNLLLQKFTEIVRKHYLDIKKDQNSNLNGAQVFLICQRLLVEFPESFTIKTKRSTTSQSNFSKTQVLVNQAILTELYNEDKMIAKMVSKQNKQINDVLQQRQDKMIELITEEVNDLRLNLETQRSKIRQLADREKYFISMLKNAKSQFYQIMNFAQSKRLEHKSMNTLLKTFHQFQQNVQKKESSESKQIRERMEELSLIQRITEQESKNKFVSY